MIIKDTYGLNIAIFLEVSGKRLDLIYWDLKLIVFMDLVRNRILTNSLEFRIFHCAR